ncbi:hypothetical protein [Aestuariivirga sp.]|uniref:hypothetical protein n=1 Tax=Aestuariivirga sp. TaxID=2650926 RepID=UPI0039E5CC8F
MTWAANHGESQRWADMAHVNLRRGDAKAAEECFKMAAQFELDAYNALSPEKIRTLGITAVSVVSLFYKANELAEAENYAHRFCADLRLPEFANEELKSLLYLIWQKQEQVKSSVTFAPGNILVSVRGGEVLRGGAPLDLIVKKVQEISNLVIRTAEFVSNTPFRRRGKPIHEIAEQCVPWLFQTVPGSYQFIVAIQEKRQPDLFKRSIDAEDISSKLLEIIRTAAASPDEDMAAVVPDSQYRDVFLKMARNIAPNGRRFEQIEISSPMGRVPPVVLSAENRDQIAKVVQTEIATSKASLQDEVFTAQGILRGLDLDRDFIVVQTAETNLKIFETGDVVDDLIGPMVNQLVSIKYRRSRKTKQEILLFVDIEALE